MKQVKDLCIGSKMYKAEIGQIVPQTIESLSFDRDTSKIKINLSEGYSTFYGEKTDIFIIDEYNRKYFVDYKKALEEQTELRKKHYLHLLDRVEKAQKTLSEFILEYSILK